MSVQGYKPKCGNHGEICEKIDHKFKDLCSKTYYLRQEDFEKGTYRIRRSGTYILKEDIIFSPNPDLDYRPDPQDEEYQGKAYKLGFFAAITVETKDVVIDLNCYTIRQSQAFALQQRFFSVIELASAPFISGQGPHDFGDIVSADGCHIRNGKIGLSSHHGIHGNGARHVLLENMEIFNFEVCGIALNGSKYVCIQNVEIGANRQDIPVLGNYSALRFLIQFYRETIVYLVSLPPTPDIALDIALLEQCLVGLSAFSDGILEDVLMNGEITNPSFNFFKNESGLADGSCTYGILFHPVGVAVNDHIEETYKGKLSKYISVYNTNIHGIAAKPDEIIGFSSNDQGEGVFIDPSGSVIQITAVTNSVTGAYVTGNTLLDCQFRLAVIALKYDIKIGRMNINQDLINWRDGAVIDINSYLNVGYKYKCGGDSMFHVLKGLIGFRADAVTHVYVENVKIRYLKNLGLLGNETYCGNYILSHDAQVRGGYHGADIAGFSLCYVFDFKIKCTHLFNVKTLNGSACGYKIMNQSDNICLDDITVKELVSKYKFEEGIYYGQAFDGSDVELTYSFPNRFFNSYGLVIQDDNCKNVKVGEYHSKCLTASGVAARYIHSRDDTPNGVAEDPESDGEKDECPCF
jgi:hypothetical protein